MTNHRIHDGERYLASEIESGERVMQCPITGREYRVTRWASRNGRVIALEKSERIAGDGGVDVERFVEHPSPDRFFMQIEPAEIEMRVHDHDDVTFKTQLVPGGSFGVELTASYSYGGRDCKQHLSLNRGAAESLHERLGEILEADPRE